MHPLFLFYFGHMQYSSLVAILLCFCISASAQLFDDFDDGDIASNPTWSGDVSDFIVNDEFRLQLDAPTAGTSRLWTSVSFSDSLRWSFDYLMDFGPSSANNLRVYLMVDSAEPSTATGYAIDIGENGGDDALHLIRLTGGSETSVASSPGIFGDDPSEATISIERMKDGTWLGRATVNGSETQLFVVTDNGSSPATAAFFGFQCVYSETRKDLFSFDNFRIQPLIADVTPPEFTSVTAEAGDHLVLQFDEAIDPASFNLSQISVDQGIGFPTQAFLSVGDASKLEIMLSTNLINNTTYQVAVTDIADLAGNLSGNQSRSLTYVEPEVPAPFDILINELMVDPSPQISLPNAEYLEIFNASDKTFDLSTVRLRVGSNTINLPETSFGPGQYVIVTDDSDAADFEVYGTVVQVGSFPALTNSGTSVELLGAGDLSIHQITYDLSWYADPSKDEGGWSLELINPNNPCALASNWRASVSLTGGSPGQANSVYDISDPDQTGPQVISLFPDPGGNAIVLTFDEIIGDQSPVITLTPPAGDIVIASGGNLMTLILSGSLATSTIYTLRVEQATDCLGNVSVVQELTFGLPSDPEPGDLLINELLFDPQTGGARYMELYNQSTKFISTTELNVIERRADEVDVRTIATEFLIAPASYVVLTDDPGDVVSRYPTRDVDVIIAADLPAFDRTASTAGIIDKFGIAIDTFPYSDDLHNALIDDTDGVSLERISFLASTLDPNNWQSAARSVGFGTPGLPNSQSIPNVSGEGVYEIVNTTFSPDGDGFEDFTIVRFVEPRPGSLATIRVFDALGREVNQILRNDVLGAGTLAQWDGATSEGLPAPMGIYILLIETFDAEGNTMKYKEPIVLATRL